MHVLVKDNTVVTYPYSEHDLRKANPQISFPSVFSEELLAEYGVFSVTGTERPSFDPITQDLTELTPVLVSGVWTQAWGVTDVSPEETQRRQQEYVASQKAQRAEAYRQEADPLYFKSQRGEATLAEWELKVAEIKARYPYLEE